MTSRARIKFERVKVTLVEVEVEGAASEDEAERLAWDHLGWGEGTVQDTNTHGDPVYITIWEEPGGYDSEISDFEWTPDVEES